MIALQQDPTFLERIAAEPALVQLVLLLFVAAAAWLVVARLVRRAHQAKSRAAVRDELLGVELLLAGDPGEAARRLQRAVAADPGDATARLAHALALGALGRASEAHRAHVELRTGFDEESFVNTLGLARALLDAGRESDALEAAEEAKRMRPHDPGALAALARAADAAGVRDVAFEAGLELARRADSGAQRAQAVDDALRLAELAIGGELRVGHVTRAAQHLVALRSAVGESSAVARLSLRVDAASGAELIPIPDALHALAIADHGPAGLLGELDSAARAVDAIEANDAHVERLCDRWADGHADAAEELVELGTSAVPALFRRAVQAGPDDERFPAVLHRGGVAVLPAVLNAFAATAPRGARTMRAKRSRPTGTLSRIVLGFGVGALSILEERLTTGDRDLRKVLIDWFVALGDPMVFGRVVEACAPVELLHRLNQSESAALTRLLRALPRGHVVLDVLLAETAFERDRELLLAIPGAAAPDVLESLLVRRGPTRASLRALVEHVADPDLRPVVDRVLRAFGDRALPQLVSAYADLDRPGPQRRALAALLDASGPAIVPLLCDGFGSAPAALDADLIARLSAIGDAAVDPLLDAYRRGGLVERLAGPLARRRTHRRERILQAIGGIGGLRARAALQELMREETDADLKLRLAHRLHALDAEPSRTPKQPRSERREEGDRGQTG